MMLSAPQRPAIGVWLEWPAATASSFKVEGMSRLLGFLIEGAAQSGCCTFRVVVPSAMAVGAGDFLRSLDAVEGRDWTLHAAAVTGPHWERVSPEAAGRVMAVAGLMLVPLLSLLALLRLLLRALLRPLARLVSQRVAVAMEAARDPLAGATFAAGWLRRRPFGLGKRLADLVDRWRAGVAGRTIESPTAAQTDEEMQVGPDEPALLDPLSTHLAKSFGRSVLVDGWLIFFPHFTAGTLLPGPRAVLFPDAIPVEFPMGWSDADWLPGGGWQRWLQRTRHVLAQGDPVITFSRHVAERHVQGIFGVAPDRCHVVPHAPPQLDSLLPFLPPSRRATPASRAAAAALLRKHAAERNWTYLREFPFEEISYLVISTQDRPNKNIGLVVEAVRRLIRRDLVDIKLLITATIDDNSMLQKQIQEIGLHHDVVALPHLPADVHAALFHGAALAVHPSVFEGGRAPFPFSEAVSVGTPCIMADGSHVQEFLQEHDVRDAVFDPYDAESLVDLIKTTLDNRAAVLARQEAILRSMAQRNWGQVAAEYAAAVLGRESRGCNAKPAENNLSASVATHQTVNEPG
jgi:glycosyltransferase involved in cell wall biosynthesis